MRKDKEHTPGSDSTLYVGKQTQGHSTL